MGMAATGPAVPQGRGGLGQPGGASSTAAVVMSEQAYRLLQQRAAQSQLADDSTALRWLLELPVAASPRTKDEIDAALAEERNW